MRHDTLNGMNIMRHDTINVMNIMRHDTLKRLNNISEAISFHTVWGLVK